MDILKHDPSAFLCTFEDSITGAFFLALSHGNVDKFSVGCSDVIGLSNLLDFGCGVDSWEKNEEYRSGWSCFFVGVENVEGLLFNVLLAHGVANIGGQCRRKPVRPHSSEKKQTMEFAHFFKGFWEVCKFCFFLVEPFPPLKGFDLKGIAEVLKGRNLFKTLASSPDILLDEVLKDVGHGARIWIELTHNQMLHFACF